MAAKIRKGDLVEVVRGRTSDEKELAKRNARRAEQGLEPLKPGDKGKQGRVIRVFPAQEKVLVEGINLKTRHVRQGQTQGQAGGIILGAVDAQAGGQALDRGGQGRLRGAQVALGVERHDVGVDHLCHVRLLR